MENAKKNNKSNDFVISNLNEYGLLLLTLNFFL